MYIRFALEHNGHDNRFCAAYSDCVQHIVECGRVQVGLQPSSDADIRTVRHSDMILFPKRKRIERRSLSYSFTSKFFSYFIHYKLRCILSGEYKPFVPSVSRAAPRDPISDELFSLIPRTSLDAQQRLLQIRLRLDQLPAPPVPEQRQRRTQPVTEHDPLSRDSDLAD